MADTKILFFDVETTGVDYKAHCIHQFAGLLEINGEVVEEFNLNMAPKEGAEINDDALAISNVTREQLADYPNAVGTMFAFQKTLKKHIDPYGKTDKAFLAGYNNVGFDNLFLRAAWPDNYFGSFFWSNSLDVMVFASQYLLHDRPNMENFKLGTVAEYLGVEIEGELHDALTDVRLTRAIYNTVFLKDVKG